MAGVSLLALLDDIASTLDDVALMTKVAAKKTAGVLGDDLALNAQQISGVNANRELPVVWNVAKGSFVNKLILIPTAILISSFMPWLITPLLMVGGAFLCFEGAEKLVHKFFHKDVHEAQKVKILEENIDLVAYEKTKIKGAIRTDFILSAEIIVIALGSIDPNQSVWVRLAVLSLIGIIMTIGVYGLVGAIIKLDDLGFFIIKRAKKGSIKHKLGSLLVNASPYLMRFLTIVGTIAMFMVGGGILVHGFPFFHTMTDQIAQLFAGGLLNTLLNALIGVMTGLVLVCLIKFGSKQFKH